MKRIALIFVMTLAPMTAQSAASSRALLDLGSILGSEIICSLNLKPDAITDWVDKNIPADDMSFADKLNSVAISQAHMYAEQSEAARETHCAAITRTAKHFGFID